MHENDFSAAPEYNVRASRKPAIVQSIAIAHAMHQAPHDHLGLRVLRANAAHAFGSLGFGEGVNHNGETRPDENSINTGKR